MSEKYYMVVVTHFGARKIKEFTDEEQAHRIAKVKKGTLYEFDHRPELHEDPTSGKLIADYSSEKQENL